VFPLVRPLSIIVFAFCRAFVDYFAFYMTPKHCAEALSKVLKYRKVVMYFMEKRHVLDKFCSSMSYSALGCEFNDSESTVCIK
jgi:hypothetical protein